jgi:hypothetical protein
MTELIRSVAVTQARSPGDGFKPKPLDTWSSVKQSGDIALYLDGVEATMALHGEMDEEARALVAATYLRGEGQRRWTTMKANFIREGVPITYSLFRDSLIGIFAHGHEQDEGISRLLELQEKPGRNDDYRSSFESIRAILPHDSKEALELILVGIYRRGLTREVSARVSIDPTTGKRHRNLATLQDQAKCASEVQRGMGGKSMPPPSSRITPTSLKPKVRSF